MDILILTHGETDQYKKYGLDAPMSALGINRIKQSSSWINANIKTEKYFGLTSPYQSCLETVSIFQEKNKVDFAISQSVRNLILEDNLKGITIYSKKNKFKNIYWNSFWDKQKVFFKSETKDNFKKRISSFVEKLHLDKNYIIVTHKSVCKYMFEHITGESVDSLPGDSSVTYIKDKKPVWFSKLLYD